MDLLITPGDLMNLPAHTLRGLAHCTPAEGRVRVQALLDALPGMADRSRRETLARSLPRQVASLPPAVCLALSQLAEALLPHAPTIPDDIDALSPQLQVAWYRVAIAAGHIPPDDATLLRAVCGWSFSTVMHLQPLFARLTRAEDPRLRWIALQHLPTAVATLALSGPAALECAIDLAADDEPALQLAALRSPIFVASAANRGQESWREDVLLTGLNADTPRVVMAALTACATLCRRDWLIDYLTDADRPIRLRAAAMRALGPLAQTEDLPVVIAIGDTPGFEAACRDCLLDAHRHGIFLQADQIEALLAQFDRHPSWRAEEVVRISFIQRNALIEALARLPFDDMRWRRRAALLAQSALPAATQLLQRGLKAAESVEIGTAFVEAAGRAPAFADEIALLKWLERAPEAVLRAVRHKAQDHAHTLIERFILRPDLDHTVRAQAIEVLWALTPDRAGMLLRLSTQLGPRAVGLLDGRRRLSVAPKAEVLSRAPWDDAAFPLDSATQLRAYCASSDPRFIDEVAHLFRIEVTACVRRALAGDFSAKRVQLPALEQQVYAYGRRLVDRGHVVRTWVDDAPETGRDLVLRLMGDWIAETPERAILVALFEMLERHIPDRALLRRIEPFWRHGDREVRRAAIDALLAAEHAGLSFSLARLVAHPSPRIAARGLEAVRVFGTTAWERWARAALERPEMAVKKKAAEALGRCGTPASAQALIGWLGRHDNASFRALLAPALSHALGQNAAAALVDAIDAATDGRTRALLLEALGGRLTLAGLCRVLWAQRPCAPFLAEAACAGRLRIADATATQVAARLHQLDVGVSTTAADPTAEFLRLGFSAARAQSLLEHWETHRGAVMTAVRRALPEWLDWCATDAPPRALTVALSAADRTHTALWPALLDLSLAAPPAVALAFIQRCLVRAPDAVRWRAIDVVRRLPPAAEPGGLARYRLLGALHAVRTADDLRMCLAECARGPDLGDRSTQLLREALALPEEHSDQDLTTLWKTAAHWHQATPADRAAWLDHALALCPLGVALAPTLPVIRQLPPGPVTTADVPRLRAALDDATLAQRAARTILATPTAHALRSLVLARWLAGDLSLPRDTLPALAALIDEWPDTPRAQTLVPHLSRARLRHFIPIWIAQRAAGNAQADALLRTIGEPLRPFVWAGKVQDPTLTRLVALDPPLRAWLRTHAPDELPIDAAPVESAPASADPLAGLDLRGLVALVEDRTQPEGLVVRALHAVAQRGDAAIDPLTRWAVDPRARIRSAALRALRSVAPKDRRLAAAAQALTIETRRQEIARLLRVLGHGGYDAKVLVAYVLHRDDAVAAAAEDALMACGEAALPALRQAQRRARPDKRSVYTRIIEAIDP